MGYSIGTEFANTRHKAGTVATDIAQEMAIDLIRAVGYSGPEDHDDTLEEVGDLTQTALALALARSAALREFIGNALVSHKQRGVKTDTYNSEVRDPGKAAGGDVPDDYGILEIIDARGVSTPFVFVVDWENGTLDPSHVVNDTREALMHIREQHELQRREGVR